MTRVATVTPGSIRHNDLIRLRSRKMTSGPESELVDTFLNFILSTSHDASPTEWALFREPALLTGFPDLVFVEYFEHSFSNWKSERNRLSVEDLKILQHLYRQSGTLPIEQIMVTLGITHDRLVRSLDSLEAAELITGDCRAIELRADCPSFGLKRIVAIEAKVSNGKAAIQQSAMNRWFASHCYSLLPNAGEASRLKLLAQERQTGLILLESQEPQIVELSPRTALPASYGSWQFNEWVGRSLFC